VNLEDGSGHLVVGNTVTGPRGITVGGMQTMPHPEIHWEDNVLCQGALPSGCGMGVEFTSTATNVYDGAEICGIQKDPVRTCESLGY
jgi:hypothetical protein